MQPRKILPPTLFWIVLAAMGLLRLVWPVFVFLRFPFTLTGLIPLLAGFGVMMAAWKLFREKQTNLNPFSSPGAFVTRGPYRFSRNPMYLGMLLMLTGAWLFFGALSPGLGVLAFILIVERWYIGFEEREMTVRFGQEYEAYRASVRRWL